MTNLVKVELPKLANQLFALNWAVAKAEGLLIEDGGNAKVFGEQIKVHPSTLGTVYTPTTDWSQAGEIIEREHIAIDYSDSGNEWCACLYDPNARTYSSGKPLIAAMLTYVQFKFGDALMVPKELLNQ